MKQGDNTRSLQTRPSPPADRRRSAEGGWPLVPAVGLAAGVFLADLVTPRGIAASVLYAPVMLLGWTLRRPRMVLMLLALGTVLTVIGCVQSPPGGFGWMVLATRTSSVLAMTAVAAWGVVGTRALSILAIWTLAIFGLMRRHSEREARASHGSRSNADPGHKRGESDGHH